MISVTHFRSTDPEFAARARTALSALGARPGFVRGSLGRSTDEITDWVLITEWSNVGSYRRALGNYEVKLHATPLLGESVDVPSSFEAILELAADGALAVHASDHT